MRQSVISLAAVLVFASAISIGCGSDDDSSGPGAGAGGKGGTSGAAGKGGGASGSAGKGGSSGASGGSFGANGGGETVAGAAGAEAAGAGGAESAGAAGTGSAGESGAAGAPPYTEEMIVRGGQLVRSVALCGGCHTATGGVELAGNPAFKNSTLPAPNLTPDETGLGNWTDEQIMNAFRNGVDDQGRHLDPIMPAWLFHNMSDADALDIVAFLRSLPKVVGDYGGANPDAAPATPLSPASFPNSSLAVSDANYAAAQLGKELLSGVAQCVKCHSPSTAGLPSGSFFSGAAPANNTTIFSSNLTPDATGIAGWTAADVATALKAGTNKAGTALCGSMPSGSKGYGNLTDADAKAIGIYLTTIPAVANANAAPSLEPACP